MRAVAVGPDHALTIRTVADPVCRPHEVVLAVRATAVNRADLLQRRGLYPPPLGASPILGLEAAGEIVEVGSEVTGWTPGDRVAALLAGGGYAERVACPAGHLLPVGDLGWDEAAALPEVLATCWLNLVHEAHVGPGERVLVHAGASGVGTMAIQVARFLGARVWVSAGTEDKISHCVALGAEAGAIRGAFAAEVGAWTNGAGMDAILCPVGAAYLDANLKALAVDGRLVIIGLMGGRSAQLDLGRLLVKRLRVLGSTLRSRSDASKAALLSDIRARVWPAVLDGRIRAPIHTRLPLDEVEAAHALVARDENLGRWC
jgi:putative PIG3 family NAD(P)H quinone oxidoreductase